jgi:hypothetical protein
MVRRRHPILFEKPMLLHILQFVSPLGNTLHKAGNGANSITCRNRHCPKCQANARDRWLEARAKDLLPTRYVHVVFTLPRHLSPLALQNKREIYALLFRASAETLLEVARDPKHLGAEIGFFSVLHTWNQKLQHHPHVHCVVPAGGLSPDHSRWVRPRHEKFFLPESVLSEVFRGKFTDALEQSFVAGDLGFHGQLKTLAQPRLFRSFLPQLFRHRWVVYYKPPFGGFDQVLRYLGAYTHRVAISNHRLVSFDGEKISFRSRDSAHSNKKRLMTLCAGEFLRRFLLHVLPRGFVRIATSVSLPAADAVYSSHCANNYWPIPLCPCPCATPRPRRSRQ